jgi:ribosomal protein S18 acetylase RimI-like enzyme
VRESPNTPLEPTAGKPSRLTASACGRRRLNGRSLAPQAESRMSASIRRAVSLDLEQLVPLFDGYRQFYGKNSDASLARDFLRDRLTLGDSIVLIAEQFDRRGVGFVQMYPSFSSVRAARIYILNDLFVVPFARGRGIGSLLLQNAAEVAREAGAVRMQLSTAITNVSAQRLYEGLGWKRDEEFYEYGLSL